MDIQTYLANRNKTTAITHRGVCSRCWKSESTCICHMIRSFDSPVPFVIVQHIMEARNPIATARMAHLSINNSTLVMDTTFESNHKIESLLSDKSSQHIILYPSKEARPIEQFFDHPDKRPPTFWVLDTKWTHVNKMLKSSAALRSIPMAMFQPTTSSRFQIRKQPHPLCLSTIESIYIVIDRYLKHHNVRQDSHESLLTVFMYMVDQQLQFARDRKSDRHRHNRVKRARQK